MNPSTAPRARTTRAASTERTRERILDIARERFLTSSYDDVTLAGIAEEAGVTQQTVLNHFSRKEGLFTTVVQALAGEVDLVRRSVRRGSVRSVVRVLLEQYELIGDANVRMLALEDRFPLLHELLETARRQHRGWLEEALGQHLPDDARARASTLTALHAVSDVYVWKLLRRDLATSLAETRRVMERLVSAALAEQP